MRCLTALFIAMVIVVFSLPASAQVYEYRDADGIIRFTDDLGNVPAAQRENVKRIRSVPFTSSPEDWEDPPDEIDDVFLENGDGGEAGENLFEMGEALRSEQAELQAEYDSIEEAKAALGEAPARGASREALDAYGGGIDAINERIEAYQKRLADFEKRAEAYNARFEQ